METACVVFDVLCVSVSATVSREGCCDGVCMCIVTILCVCSRVLDKSDGRK